MRSKIYVCSVCGKRSRDKYGKDPVNYGWDVSCVLNSVECFEDSLVIENDRVVRVEEGGIVESQGDSRAERVVYESSQEKEKIS